MEPVLSGLCREVCSISLSGSGYYKKRSANSRCGAMRERVGREA